MRALVYALLLLTAVSGRAIAAGTDEWKGVSVTVMNEISLVARAEVDASCGEVWKVLTELDKLRRLAPHLGLFSPTGQRTAEQRGDVVRLNVQKSSGTMTGQFVLTTPVPYERIQAVLAPDRGPWMRIQEWTLKPAGAASCTVDYNEAYNELWVRGVGILGSDFIRKNRDHHMHVILRRIKNMAEGKEPGLPEELDYLFEDARIFPDKFRVAAK